MVVMIFQTKNRIVNKIASFERDVPKFYIEGHTLDSRNGEHGSKPPPARGGIR